MFLEMDFSLSIHKFRFVITEILYCLLIIYYVLCNWNFFGNFYIDDNIYCILGDVFIYSIR